MIKVTLKFGGRITKIIVNPGDDDNLRRLRALVMGIYTDFNCDIPDSILLEASGPSIIWIQENFRVGTATIPFPVLNWQGEGEIGELFKSRQRDSIFWSGDIAMTILLNL